MTNAPTPPRILSIAGSDSSGGAGIQADIKTITMLGGFAMTAITAVTAQNSLGVTGVAALSPETVAAQIDACVSDIGVDAVKIGMLGSAAIAEVVAERLESLDVPVVFDPVMISTSGSVLADDDTVAAFARLIRRATLTTPNLPELQALLGHKIDPKAQALADAARSFLTRTGGHALLAKGGHFPSDFILREGVQSSSADNAAERVFDCLYAVGPEEEWREWVFDHPRVQTRHTHGTGCTLSSAIAVELGRGRELPESVERGGEFVRAALEAAPGFGAGHGPMGHQAVLPDRTATDT